MLLYQTAANAVDSLPVVAGWHTVCPTPFGDDHHCAHRRPAGWPPTQQEHPVNYHCQENHELWRWEVWTEDEISLSTPLCAQPQGVRSILLSFRLLSAARWFLGAGCVYVFVKIYLFNTCTQADSLIVTVHWFYICHLRNWVQTMYHA